MDVTGLFFKDTSRQTFHFKGDDCAGGKRSKERITVLLCASSAGEKFKPLEIGKSKQPVSDKLMWTDGQSSDYMLSLRGALKQQANMSVFNSNP